MKKMLKWSNKLNIEAFGKGPIPFEAKWTDVLDWILNQSTSPWKLEILSSWGPGSESLKVKAASLFKLRDPLKAKFSKVLATLKAASLKVEPVFEALVLTVRAKEVLVSPVFFCQVHLHLFLAPYQIMKSHLSWQDCALQEPEQPRQCPNLSSPT